MREIKFRAWLKNEHKMVDVVSINIDSCFIQYFDIVNGCTKYDLCASFDEIELMQYTGLKDKNGTEIYEGDIVGIIDTLYITNYPATYQRGFVGKIRDYKGCFMVQENDKNEECLWNIDNYLIEVLGNAYENPELLEV